MIVFLRVLAMEWRKQRGSLASWMILAGACFTPAAVLLVRLLQPQALPRLYAHPDFWRGYWNSLWESMVVFLLPMCAVMVTALLAQIEHRNNAWKQVAVLPVAATTVYFAKLAVAAVLVAQFLLLFVVAGALGAWLPAGLYAGVAWPPEMPWLLPLRDAANYFLLALPILAAQFAISLRFPNFMVPVGAGFMAWVAALALLSWKYAPFVPYAQGIAHYMSLQPNAKIHPDAGLSAAVSLATFAAFTVAGLGAFVTRKVKG